MSLPLLAEQLPAALAHRLDGARQIEPVQISASGAAVYRIVDAGGATCYLKMASGDTGRELRHEAERTEWLAGRLPVPQVLFAGEDADRSYLLTAAVAGVDAATLATEHAGADMAQIARLLADGLRQIHALPIADCPFDHRLPRQIQRARRRVESAAVDPSDFDEDWQGRTPDDLFAELLETQPPDEDLVFAHGDYCLPNILLSDLDTGGHVRAFIDLGRAGVSDRYRDLALCRRSLIRNCGPASVPHFFAAYGLPQPDEAKMTFYRMMDEFF